MEPTALTATRLGPYRLVERIGAGAMGAVYRAEFEEGSVALKVIHSHLLERAGYFKRFQREAEAGRRVEHENVVRTLDCDLLLADGEPRFFLVMEYVRGRTLRELVCEKGALPEALVREIGRQVAAGLAAIHAAGIVHRDLKPENVMIADDHRVRIMDLGVARLEGAGARLTQSGQFAGSLLYAAPEQFRGGRVGPEADLYALGVLLHELIVGENPFRRNRVAAVMRAHLDQVPPRLDERDPEASLFLAEVVATLLAKAPADRFRTAASLERALADGERSDWWTGRRRAARERGARLPRIPVRRETGLHGREAELATLRGLWQRSVAGEGRVVWLDGEAGVGKTRLVDAFVRELGGAHAHVLYGSYAPSGGHTGITDGMLGHFGPARLEETLGACLAGTPSLVPALVAAVRHEPQPAGSALPAALTALMEALAAERPLIWIVEDLHLAERESLKRLLSLARAVAGRRVLLLLTGRPGLPAAQRAAFERLATFERLTLGRLGSGAVTRLLADALRNPALADKLAGRIATASDGIPFLVLEILRSLKERRVVEELPDGTFAATQAIERIEVPPAVRDLVRARLEGLAYDERAVLEVGAVLGFVFDPYLVARALGRAPVEVLESLADVERGRGVVRADGAGYRFDHHQIREVVLEDVSGPLGREYHARVADAFAAREGLEEAEADRASADASFFLASHRLAGRDPATALPWLRPALAHSPAEQRSERALGLVQRALAVPGLVVRRERIDLLLTASSRLDLLGRSLDALGPAEEALSIARDIGDVGSCSAASRMLGWALSHLGRIEDAEARLREAVGLAAASADPEAQMEAAGLLGSFLLQMDRDEEALPHLERQARLGRETGDRRATSNARANLGVVRMDQGRYDEARVHMLEALELHQARGDLGGASRAIGNLGLIASHLGESDEAVARYEDQLRIARDIGDRRSEANARVNLSAELLARGEHERAGEHLEYQLALARDLGDRYLEAIARWNLGELAWARGRLAHAREHLEVALAMSDVYGSREGEAELKVNLGRLACGLGDAVVAVEMLRAGLELSREIGDLRIESLASLGLSQAAALQGRAPDARAWAERAVECVRESAEPKARLEPLIELGARAAGDGDAEQAAAVFTEVLQVAEACDTPGPRAVAAAYLALVTGDATPARQALAEHERHLSVGERLTVHALLWKTTRERTHLEAAWRLVYALRADAPEECRAPLLENVPLHREIAEAWAEHGQGQSGRATSAPSA